MLKKKSLIFNPYNTFIISRTLELYFAEIVENGKTLDQMTYSNQYDSTVPWFQFLSQLFISDILVF